MTWAVTCGNGARTPTEKIITDMRHPGTPLVPHPRPIGCCAVAVGAAIAARSAPPTGITTWPPTATWRSDFAASDRDVYRSWGRTPAELNAGSCPAIWSFGYDHRA